MLKIMLKMHMKLNSPNDALSKLLLVKLQLPVIRPGTVPREKLLNELANNLDRKLLTITGDAGYGKTTLLAQIREKAHLPCVFISLEPGDSDLATFFSYLVWGLEKLQSGLVRRCRGLVERGTEIGQNTRLAMGTLINELVEKRNEELFILLDDFHNISEDSSVLEALDYFIDHLPVSVHVLIASRKEPALPSLPKWRAKREIKEISRDALRFDERDTRELLIQGYGLDTSETEVSSILARTEGWVTGMHLILQTTDKNNIRAKTDLKLSDQGDLFRYFAGEIFNRERKDIGDFMRQISVLDNMTPEICGYVTGVKDAAGKLADLAKVNLFIVHTGEREYRFHRLFREFLYDRLDDPSERSNLHFRAAGYYEKANDKFKAIEHYLSAGKHQDAVRLLAVEREAMINRAQFTLLGSWLEKVPGHIFDENPWLYSVQAVLCKEKGKLEQAEEYYSLADKGIRTKGTNDSSGAFVLYEKSIVLHRKGEYASALRTLEEALKSCPSENSDLKISILGFTAQVWLEGLGDAKKAEANLAKAGKLLKNSSNNMQAVYVEQKRAILLESAGEKRRAFYVYKGIIEKIGDQYSHLVGSYFHNAAKVALDYGRIEWAEQCLVKGQSLCRGYEDAFSESMLEFGFGYLYLFRGSWVQAEKHLNKALRIFREMNWTRSVCIALRQMSRLNRYRGDLSGAMDYLEQMKQQPLGPLDRVAVILEQALIEIGQERFKQAAESLESCRESAIKYFGKMGEIMSNLAEAGILAGQNKKKEALNRLTKSVNIAKEYGFDGLLSCELRSNQVLARLAGSCREENLYLATIPSFSSKDIKPETICDLRFEFIEQPRILHHNKDISKELRHQAQELLFLLAYNRDRGLTREEILNSLWPSARTKQAVDNFHLLLFELRKGLQKIMGKNHGKLVVKESGRYLIDRSLRVESDVFELEKLWSDSKDAEMEGQKESAKQMLGLSLRLLRGDFCKGWDSEWVQETARKYEERREKIMLKLGTLHYRDGEYEQGLENYLNVLNSNNFSEEAARGIIRIYGTTGRMNEAKTIYNRLNKMLSKELGVEPSKETKDLLQTFTNLGK